MEADILRLILIVLGAMVVLGIYFWERHKRINVRIREIEKARKKKQEPGIGVPDDALEAKRSVVADGLDEELGRLRTLVDEERELRGPEPRAQGQASPPSDPSTPEAHGAMADDEGYPPDPSVPVMILQINVVSKGGDFTGTDILRASREVGLEEGDMRIFHRRVNGSGRGPVLFSMASMVEPGTFPMDSMDSFRTPGLTLFAQLPGPRDGVAVFSGLLESAGQLAARLGGELQDETHSVLTRQTIEHIRTQVIEHQRRVRLAEKKA